MTKSEARQRAKDNWAYWRLIYSDGGIFVNADTMDIDDVAEANAALDMVEEKRKKKKG